MISTLQAETKKNFATEATQLFFNEFEQERQKEVERLMIEGYKATNLEDKDLDAEWEKATLEKND